MYTMFTIEAFLGGFNLLLFSLGSLIYEKDVQMVIAYYVYRAIKKPVGMLKVTIIKCVNLRKADVMGKSDPYVKFSLGEGTLSRKTQIKMSTLNPEWNESHTLLVQDQESQALELFVYDWEKVSLSFFVCFFRQ